MEEGKMEIANQEYEKALNFFNLAKEEKEDEEVNLLYNQTNSLVEAIDSKEKENKSEKNKEEQDSSNSTTTKTS